LKFETELQLKLNKKFVKMTNQKEKKGEQNNIFEQVQTLAIKTNHKMQESFI